MLTAAEEDYIVTHAYIPEHSVELMTRVSGGEPWLVEDCFCCHRGDWVILIGYPLRQDFRPQTFENLLDIIKKQFQPRYLSVLAPWLPRWPADTCRERESDYYYTLQMPAEILPSSVKRNIRKAQQVLRTERASEMGAAHQALMQEFVQRINPPAKVQTLLFKMPQYAALAHHAMVLNTWDTDGNLAAFYVIDLAARDFANYIIGCYSQTHYVRGASDLLLFELLKISTEQGKRYIHLGLGINAGIRKFKEKWGGRPTRRCETCELVLRKPSILETFLAIKRELTCFLDEAGKKKSK
ncbi:MAG: hypothetical protein JSW39_05110 [Desulfobacterales bacterium]|nr:MAG: hypothetical protein JSW39_05110 [Desulfobacterales bacterium]